MMVQAWGLHGQGMPRWWDKNFTLMVGRLGTAGVNFEHAPYDGATVVRMVDDAWHEACKLPLPSGRPVSSSPPPSHSHSLSFWVNARWHRSGAPPPLCTGTDQPISILSRRQQAASYYADVRHSDDS